MALDTAPILFNPRVVGIVAETTTGTPVTITTAEATLPALNADLKYEIPALEREPLATASPILRPRGARSGTMTSTFELRGKGASGTPPILPWLTACGYTDAAGTLSPTTGPTATYTIGLWRSGRRKTISGAMGTGVIRAVAGEPCYLDMTYRGVAQPNTTETPFSPTFDTVVPPRVGATTFTIGGSTYRVPEVRIDMGNNLILRQDVTGVDSASEPTGYRAAYITKRAPTVTVAAEALPFTTKDWYDIYRDGTTAALSLIIGGTVNNTWTIAAPKLQLMQVPEDQDREGMLVDNLVFLCLGNTGDDELTIAYS